MKPGPKAVEVRWLSGRAIDWATFLYELRDGYPGFVSKVEEVEHGASKMKIKRAVEVAIVVATDESLERAATLVKGKKDWTLVGPVFPMADIWQRLKRARSVADVQLVARSLRQRLGPKQCKLLHSHAQDLLRAKRLPNYPRSNRPRSDNKRIQFFAKVLAGLDFGIAPATATKRLSHVSLPDGSALGGRPRRERRNDRI